MKVYLLLKYSNHTTFNDILIQQIEILFINSSTAEKMLRIIIILCTSCTRILRK